MFVQHSCGTQALLLDECMREHACCAQVLTQQHKAALVAVQQEAERQIASVERAAERAAEDAVVACQQLCDK